MGVAGTSLTLIMRRFAADEIGGRLNQRGNDKRTPPDPVHYRRGRRWIGELAGIRVIRLMCPAIRGNVRVGVTRNPISFELNSKECDA
jgi:hypothetical protein